MKNIILYLSFSLIFIFSSCDILDVEPTTAWTGTNMPTEESHLEGILYYGYERLQNVLGVNFLVYGEMRAEVFYVNAYNVNIDKVVGNKLDNGMSLSSWATFYQVIKQANLVLKYASALLEKNQITQASAANLMGQAYCMRAFVYFYIARIWGDAPLITEPYLTNDDIVDHARDPLAKIFEQMHKDLEQGVKLIPSSSTGRTAFTQTAALAIDAQVYAWQHDYQKVIERADQVLKNTAYSLCPLYNSAIDVNATDFKTQVQASEYAGIFNAGRSKESIFELAFNLADGDDNNYLSSYLSGSFPYVRPNNAYAESFDNDDWRAIVAQQLSGGKYKVTKFTIGFSSDVDTRNIVLIRLADIYLLKAEAILNLGDSDADRRSAMTLVNTIRRRAGGTNLEIPESIYLDRANNTWEAMKDLVLEERKFELCYEGQRWFDLVRCNKVVEVLRDKTGVEINPLSIVWPVNLEEIRRSKLITQNEYYK